MGVDYHAYAVIGLRIPKKKLMVEEKVDTNNCRCTPQTINTKYCPECGVRTNYKMFREVCIEGFDPCDDMGYEGWSVVTDTDAENFFVGIIVEAGTKNERMIYDPGHLAVMMSKLKYDMEVLGVWDPDEFGLWSVLYCSY